MTSMENNGKYSALKETKHHGHHTNCKGSQNNTGCRMLAGKCVAGLCSKNIHLSFTRENVSLVRESMISFYNRLNN